MEDTGLKALFAAGGIIYIVVLLALAVIVCLWTLAPLTLYRIHWRLVEIRDLLRDLRIEIDSDAPQPPGSAGGIITLGLSPGRGPRL